jgi:L-cysteine/cystine lyase
LRPTTNNQQPILQETTMTHKISEIREEFPATQHQAYLNTGTAGPLSRPAAQAIEEWNRRELAQGRASPAAYANHYRPLVEKLRGQFARLLNATPDEIALTQHTTNGMNIATWGINWQPGDEIVTDMDEHPGALVPVFVAARRLGLTLRVVHLGSNDDTEAIVEKFRQVVNARTRLISISHVSWKTGALLPVREIAEIGRSYGAFTVVDGAQSAGAIPIDVQALGVDFYALPGQKWLCGPEGTGALYVRRSRLSDLHPTYGGYSSLRDGSAVDDAGNYLVADGAKRYEMGTVNKPGLAGISASLSLFEELGHPWITQRIQQITTTCREMLRALPGVTIITPAEHAGLTSFHIDGVDPDKAVAILGEQNVLVRSVHNPDLLRVSTSFYNDESDVLRLRDGLERVIG